MLINILDNASKYSDKKTVKLDVDLDDHEMVIAITDHGMGIPPEQLENIFMPMMRASNVGKVPGFGLGLTIAKKIIDMHRGTLTVSSEPNQTKVFIKIPVRISAG